MAISRFSKSRVGLGLPKQQSFNSFGLPVVNGLLGWFDASDTSSMSVSGGLVSQINNKSASGGSFTQSTSGKRPTLTSFGPNGYSALRFDGTDDEMRWASTVFNNRDTYSLFIVSRWNAGSLTDYEPEMTVGNTANANYGAFHYVNNNDNGASYPFNVGITSYDTQNTLYTNGSPYILEKYANGINNQWSIYKNGVYEGGRTVVTPLLTDIVNVYLAYQEAPLRYGKFDIAEVIIYNTVLSDSNKTKVRNYLNEKWGVY